MEPEITDIFDRIMNWKLRNWWFCPRCTRRLKRPMNFPARPAAQAALAVQAANNWSKFGK